MDPSALFPREAFLAIQEPRGCGPGPNNISAPQAGKPRLRTAIIPGVEVAAHVPRIVRPALWTGAGGKGGEAGSSVRRASRRLRRHAGHVMPRTPHSTAPCTLAEAMQTGAAPGQITSPAPWTGLGPKYVARPMAPTLRERARRPPAKNRNDGLAARQQPCRVLQGVGRPEDGAERGSSCPSASPRPDRHRGGEGTSAARGARRFGTVGSAEGGVWREGREEWSGVGGGQASLHRILHPAFENSHPASETAGSGR